MRTDYRSLIDSLMADLEINQGQLAKRLGTTQGTISRWRKGSKLKAEWASKIEDLARKTYRQPEADRFVLNSVKVMGRVGAGAVIMPEFEQLPYEGLFEVELDFPIREGAVAFEVEGESMHPRFSAGDVIVCWKEATRPDEALGWEAAVRTDDGRRFLKVVAEGSIPGVFDLVSHNAAPIRNVRLVWICQVGLIVPRSGWELKTRSKQHKRRKA